MRKRVNNRLARFAMALLAMVVAVSMTGAALAESFAVVQGTDSLNLRSGPGSNTQWLGSYSRSTWVRVTGEQSNFYAVNTFDNKTGYMSKNFLKSTDVLPYGNVAIVNNQKATAFLNLRSHPSYSASVLAILYNGVPLTILASDNGWYHVQMGSTVGYIRSEFATVSYQQMGSTVATIKTPNNTAVNLRSAPSINASVVRQFAGDRYVSVLLQGKGWWYVAIDGYVGFISSDFLKEGLHAARDNASDNNSGDGYAVVNNPVSTQRLNLRESPSTSSKVVTKLSNGVRLTMLVQGTVWSKVYVDSVGAVGYVQTQYIKLYNLPSTPKLTIQHPQGSFVNLRSSAALNASVVTRMSNKSSATIIAAGPEWTKVKYNNLTGYVMNYFTSIAGN